MQLQPYSTLLWRLGFAKEAYSLPQVSALYNPRTALFVKKKLAERWSRPILNASALNLGIWETPEKIVVTTTESRFPWNAVQSQDSFFRIFHFFVLFWYPRTAL